MSAKELIQIDLDLNNLKSLKQISSGGCRFKINTGQVSNAGRVTVWQINPCTKTVMSLKKLH